jgi:hypothetical protein
MNRTTHFYNRSGQVETKVTESNEAEISKLASMGRKWLAEQARRAHQNAFDNAKSGGWRMAMGVRLADFRAAWRLAA